MSLQKQLEYNKVFFMYSLLSNKAPEYNYHLSLPRPRIDIFKTSVSFSGAYLWNNLPLTVSLFCVENVMYQISLTHSCLYAYKLCL